MLSRPREIIYKPPIITNNIYSEGRIQFLAAMIWVSLEWEMCGGTIKPLQLRGVPSVLVFPIAHFHYKIISKKRTL